MKLNIISDTQDRLPRKRIGQLFQAIEKNESIPDSSINIIFTTDRKIKRLNALYRNINKPTDVLSFNIDKTSGSENIFGEIYISTETAGRYARIDGIGYYEMILWLVCHGLLHLLGYDHENIRQEKQMKTKENYYLAKINICR